MPLIVCPRLALRSLSLAASSRASKPLNPTTSTRTSTRAIPRCLHCTCTHYHYSSTHSTATKHQDNRQPPPPPRTLQAPHPRPLHRSSKHSSTSSFTPRYGSSTSRGYSKIATMAAAANPIDQLAQHVEGL